VNYGNDAGLDAQGFSPFGRVTSGMSVLNTLYGGYGEQPSQAQQQIQTQGNAFLRKHFPKLDHIVTARISG
jgi:peptidyl-prolyl cis-trans isomerase A (cyclophilin A)